MPYKDPERRRSYHREYLREWKERNPEKWRAYQAKHQRKRYGTPKRKKQLSEVRYRRHHRNKVAMLERYGARCAYCGDDRYEVLCVDHINEDGAQHRKTLEYRRLNMGGMWGYLLATPYRPDLYQILCFNCNQAKTRYGVRPDGESFKPLAYWKEMSKLRHERRAHD